MTAQPPAGPGRTLADLMRRLGDIPLHRVRLHPPPGTATVADVVTYEHCELIHGTLVEKAMGLPESLLAMTLGEYLRVFVRSRKLGKVSGEAGMMEILTGLVRMPDVAFISWDRFPGGRIPDEPVPNVVPDLAVEVLSVGNTPGEMAAKRAEYFRAGVRLVWVVDRFTRTVTTYTAVDQSRRLIATETLDGGDVLPGFTLPVHDLFAELDEQG